MSGLVGTTIALTITKTQVEDHKTDEQTDEPSSLYKDNYSETRTTVSFSSFKQSLLQKETYPRNKNSFYPSFTVVNI